MRRPMAQWLLLNFHNSVNIYYSICFERGKKHLWEVGNKHVCFGRNKRGDSSSLCLLNYPDIEFVIKISFPWSKTLLFLRPAYSHSSLQWFFPFEWHQHGAKSPSSGQQLFREGRLRFGIHSFFSKLLRVQVGTESFRFPLFLLGFYFSQKSVLELLMAH